jgi:hypothetical protein
MKTLEFRILHHPDGGETYLLAAFSAKGSAYKWAKELVEYPRSDIRSLRVVRQRGRSQEVLYRFGWAEEPSS